MRVIRTESGSVYEVEGDRIRRHNAYAAKRADDEWVKLVHPLTTESLVGHQAVLVLESLAPFGPDDYGMEGGGPTVRTTSIVTHDEGEA